VLLFSLSQVSIQNLGRFGEFCKNRTATAAGGAGPGGPGRSARWAEPHTAKAPHKPGREGPVSVMDFGENPWDDFNYRPIVDIVANKKSVYKWF